MLVHAQIELLVQQRRSSWDNLSSGQQADVEQVAMQLKEAAALGDATAKDALATLNLHGGGRSLDELD